MLEVRMREREFTARANGSIKRGMKRKEQEKEDEEKYGNSKDNT